MADPFIQQLFLSPWSGAPARGQLPQVPQRAALPTAVAELAGCLVRIPGGSGTADATYECQKQADDTYAWVQIDGGSSGPLGLLGSASGAATINSTPTDVCSVSGLVIPAGRAIKLTAMFTYQMGSTGNWATFSWLRGSTLIQAVGDAAAAASQGMARSFIYVDEPSAGTYTYTFHVVAGSGTGTMAVTNIYIEDIGAAV